MLEIFEAQQARVSIEHKRCIGYCYLNSSHITKLSLEPLREE